ncbi:unnamed protein product [Anisakis simplex]|uniref:Small ribosomal subunit protein mS31 n=1 Tax=Anisakis simplex TaxID=6269 RepID=A0A0M3J6I7_ANISI|nr:unnamed protein product [Anisakis simplex]
MLYPGDYRSGMSGEAMPQAVVEPNPKAENIFSTDLPRLDIFNAKNLSELKEHSLDFWAKSDANAARIWNQSFGPKNGFEEMIELTKKGKMWPYPINNEYLLVGIDVWRTKLADYHLPRTGPIAHFMELVCVGLSKNPYMTAEKKKSHLEW